MKKVYEDFTVEIIRPNFLVVYKSGDLLARVADEVQACKAISKNLGRTTPITVGDLKDEVVE